MPWNGQEAKTARSLCLVSHISTLSLTDTSFFSGICGGRMLHGMVEPS